MESVTDTNYTMQRMNYRSADLGTERILPVGQTPTDLPDGNFISIIQSSRGK